jgi:dephospho-CoA kinase
MNSLKNIKTIIEWIDSQTPSYIKLNESINDSYLFKSIIVIGGPGSGKSFILNKIIDGSGVRVLNSDKFFEFATKKFHIFGDSRYTIKILSDIEKWNNDKNEKIPTKVFMSKEMQEYRKEIDSVINTQLKSWIDGFLPIALDSTGQNKSKVIDKINFLKNVGYDVSVLYVNTDLDVALKRNKERDRTIPDDLVVSIYKQIQNNIGSFQSEVGSGNFHIIDNSNIDLNTLKSESMKIFNRIFDSQIRNSIGKYVVEFCKNNNKKYYHEISDNILKMLKN